MRCVGVMAVQIPRFWSAYYSSCFNPFLNGNSMYSWQALCSNTSTIKNFIMISGNINRSLEFMSEQATEVQFGHTKSTTAAPDRLDQSRG